MPPGHKHKRGPRRRARVRTMTQGWERTWRDTLRQASPPLAGQAGAVVWCVSVPAQHPFPLTGSDTLSSLPPGTDSPTACGPALVHHVPPSPGPQWAAKDRPSEPFSL